jgi:ABC-type nitrate/sulfonate/bicarbonate transport system permease component
MDPTKLRMRYLLGILVAAVVTAAALRHFLHVEVGFSRQEIRTGVLIAVAIGILLGAVFFRWKRPP